MKNMTLQSWVMKEAEFKIIWTDGSSHTCN